MDETIKMERELHELNKKVETLSQEMVKMSRVMGEIKTSLSGTEIGKDGGLVGRLEECEGGIVAIRKECEGELVKVKTEVDKLKKQIWLMMGGAAVAGYFGSILVKLLWR